MREKFMYSVDITEPVNEYIERGDRNGFNFFRTGKRTETCKK